MQCGHTIHITWKEMINDLKVKTGKTGLIEILDCHLFLSRGRDD